LKYNAYGIIISHNHPGGQLIASDEYRNITCRIISNGSILGIEVLDQVIKCKLGYYSMNEERLLYLSIK
jgi:DNA repair protein RadC